MPPHRPSQVLAVLAIALAGCATAPPVERVAEVVVCRGGQCAPVRGRAAAESAIASLSRVLLERRAASFRVCEAAPSDSHCTGQDVGVFVMGGPIPGRGALKSGRLLSAVALRDRAALQIRLEVAHTFIGTPLACADPDGVLAISDDGRATLSLEPYYCNWALVGNVFNSWSLAIREIDLDEGRLSGYYQTTTTGIGIGGGSGYLSIFLPPPAATAAVAARVGQSAPGPAPATAKATVTTAAAGSPPAADARLALVIGNAAYSGSPLRNPHNDAADVGRALRERGFEVLQVTDGTRLQMERAIEGFTRRIRAQAIIVVYYSGHGVEIDGTNYLLPVDVDLGTREDVVRQGISANAILAGFPAGGMGANLVILDACRDNPFGVRPAGIGGGLAQMDAPAGTLIAFSTSPGKVADDGEGRNSPYTKHLVRHLAGSAVPVESLFKSVRRSVIEETRGRQTPWENTSLTVDVSL